MRRTSLSGSGSNRWFTLPASGDVRHNRRRIRRLRSAGPIPAEALESRLLLSRDLYVDLASPGPAHDGSSWQSAYTDLQLALAAADTGDRILVADGTYKPTSTADRNYGFGFWRDCAILGGYAGYGAANPDARDIALYRTILSGDIGTPGDNSDNSYTVFYCTDWNLTSAAVLDGVTITAGNANGSAPDDYGGGMSIGPNTSPTLINCTFIGNSASGKGGGMYIAGGASPTLINCSFVGNSAGYDGRNGGMYDRMSASEGGGIYNIGSPKLINCTFVANSAEVYGGAFYNYFGSPTLTNCIVWACGTTPLYSYNMGTPMISYSIIQGGSGTMASDPMFVRSPWAGPDGVFGTADDDPGDLRLRAGSPAINTGSSQAVPAGITTDLAGNPRIQGSMVDMGAYEGANSAPNPRTLYVDASATGTNTGASWTNAFTSLQSALAAAGDGDTIQVADGTYKPTSSTDRNATFALRNKVALYGGYAGDGAADPDARDTRLYPSILSGDIGTIGSNSDNSNHVVLGIGLLSAVVLDGFTISGGYGEAGGGMLSISSSPTLNNCIFSGSTAIHGGGMAILGTSAPTITHCTFLGNSTVDGDWGGGMFTLVSSPSLSYCSFIRNSSGGMYNDSFRNTFPASPILANVSFLGNRGGGMINISSEPTVTDGLFVGNSASQGGGVYNGSTWYGTFTNCTFAANVATTGGAMYSDGQAPWAPTLTNCIVWGNGSAPLYFAPGGAPTLSRCDIQGGGSSGGNLDADPRFVRTPLPGADGTWGTEDDDYGNLRLRYTSPCIDAGSTSSSPARILTDLAGNFRYVDVPSVGDTGFGQLPLIDLGVYEMPATPDTTSPTLTTITINDGAAQRSMVKKVAVSFSEPMSLVPGALSVKLSSGLAVPNTTITLANPSDDQRSFVLTFSGPGAVGGSLADGIYDLLISAAGAQDLAGNTLTADYTQRFHRLFGDVDGNRVVNALDYAKLKATYGRASADPLFNSAFDYEGNGVINALDLAHFRKRYGLSYSY